MTTLTNSELESICDRIGPSNVIDWPKQCVLLIGDKMFTYVVCGDGWALWCIE
jgi:hypothetical protein